MSKQAQQTSLIPAWMPGDNVRIISTGLVGTVLSPVSWEMDIWWVEINATMPVRVHATGMVRFEPGHLAV